MPKKDECWNKGTDGRSCGEPLINNNNVHSDVERHLGCDTECGEDGLSLRRATAGITYFRQQLIVPEGAPTEQNAPLVIDFEVACLWDSSKPEPPHYT